MTSNVIFLSDVRNAREPEIQDEVQQAKALISQLDRPLRLELFKALEKAVLADVARQKGKPGHA